ncbi:MAG TPA: hypothetical protein P5136_01085 [Methanofastidiosum sp.]|nr:hypothetical protein [Methanofastidiosum sp.]
MKTDDREILIENKKLEYFGKALFIERNSSQAGMSYHVFHYPMKNKALLILTKEPIVINKVVLRHYISWKERPSVKEIIPGAHGEWYCSIYPGKDLSDLDMPQKEKVYEPVREHIIFMNKNSVLEFVMMYFLEIKS